MGKLTGGDRNRAYSGVTGQGVSASLQEGAGIHRWWTGVEEEDGNGRTKKGRCMRVACLVVAAQQQKLKLICSYFIHVVV